MGFPGNGFGIDVLVEFHVARVNAEDLETTVFVGHTDIDFSIESAETTKSGVDGVGAVGTSNDNDGCTLLEAVHKGQHLTDDAAFDFSVGLITLGSNGIDFVDKNNRGGVLLCLFEGLAKIRLGLTGHFRHDFWSVDEEEKGTGFVGNRTCDQRLSAAGRPVQQNPAGWLDTERLEKHGMAKRELDHFTDLRHLFPASTDVVVTDVVHLFFVLALYRVSLAVDDGVWSNDAIGAGIRFHDFEFHRMHSGSDQKQVSLFDRTVGLQKVRLQVDLEEISRNSLDGIVQGQDVNALAVRNISTGGDGDDVAQPDSQVFSNHLVHANVRVLAFFVR
mmetsp:Transcript_14740/g.30439  ORF Transcript_14740/g.30439 Transcript_14740/m.30439 type:complete len:332 (-) Transcript_14740:364-1359(-)